jgi:hypothetical protein
MEGVARPGSMKSKPFVESKALALVELSHILSVRGRPTDSC